MNLEPKIFKNRDGTQILYDTNSGKYYSLETNLPSPRTVNRKQQASKTNQEIFQGPKSSATKSSYIQHTTIENETKSPTKKAGARQQKEMCKQATTWHSEGDEDALYHASVSEQVDNRTNMPTSTESDEMNIREHEQCNVESIDKTDDQYESSTAANKRSLNESDDFTLVQSNKSRKNEHNNIEIRSNSNVTTVSSRESTMNRNNSNIPLDQIHRAISHNLPCFTINFDEPKHLPSVVAASDALYDHFERSNIQISNKFSVIRYIGNQLKVGVKNKEDYQKLCNTKVWPSELQGGKISITLPKYTPDQFSLVVRYVPQEFSVEHVAKEVKKSASSVENFREIVYPYVRETNDFRFTVADPEEYNGLLKLGLIGVGNKLCKVTIYRPANKLTFCNKCWAVGHIRSQCNQSWQKCKICLENYSNGHNETCSKQYKCAQCKKEHYSIDANCEIIQEYRAKLNRPVKHATEEGVIRHIPSRAQVIGSTQRLEFSNDMFPPLPNASVQRTFKPAPWKTTTASTTVQVTDQVPPTDLTNQQLFDKICLMFDDKVDKIKTHILEVEIKSKENEKMALDIRQNVVNLIKLMKTFISDIIPPLVTSSLIKNSKTKEAVEQATSIMKDQLSAVYADMGLDNAVYGTKDKEKDKDQFQVERQTNTPLQSQNA